MNSSDSEHTDFTPGDTEPSGEPTETGLAEKDSVETDPVPTEGADMTSSEKALPETDSDSTAWSRFLLVQVGLVVCVVAAGAYRAQQWSQTTALPPLRNEPIRVRPTYDRPRMISDEQLLRVLTKLKPPQITAETKINHLDHALRFWGVTASFGDGDAPSGSAIQLLLMDDRRFQDVYGTEVPALLLDKGEGVEVAVQQGASTSSHYDHTMASLAEVGTKLDAPVWTRRRETTYRAMVEQSLREFSLNQVEYEWSALTYAMFLPPAQSWVSREGQRVTFDMLAGRLMRQASEQGVCFGNHRLYTLAILLRIDDEHGLFTHPDTRDEVHAYLKDITNRLVSHQHPEGYWDGDWPYAIAADMDGGRAAVPDQLLATGHALEWWAMAPESLHPPREVLVRASQFLVKTVDNLSSDETAQWYTYLSHVGRALCLWRGKFAEEVELSKTKEGVSFRHSDLKLRNWVTSHAQGNLYTLAQSCFTAALTHTQSAIYNHHEVVPRDTHKPFPVFNLRKTENGFGGFLDSGTGCALTERTGNGKRVLPSQSLMAADLLCGGEELPVIIFLNTVPEVLEMLKKLWNDEVGAIVSAEIVLIATILVIGMVAGLASLRDAVVSELADVGQAIASQNQSYTVGGITAHGASVAGFGFEDALDFCDADGVTASAKCLVISEVGPSVGGEVGVQ